MHQKRLHILPIAEIIFNSLFQTGELEKPVQIGRGSAKFRETFAFFTNPRKVRKSTVKLKKWLQEIFALFTNLQKVCKRSAKDAKGLRKVQKSSVKFKDWII